jgi:hypothetical protein
MSEESTTGDGADPAADPFDDLDVEDVDEADVWAELDEGEAAAVDGDLFDRLADENPTEQVEPDLDADGETTVVPKSKYCKRCEYFADPPDVSCTHPGTTIAEVVDSERFRVRNCPVVADRHGTTDILDAE